MKYKKIKHFNLAGHVHELIFSCYRRQAFFSAPMVCEWFVEGLEASRVSNAFKLLAYVLMPNHVHLLIFPYENEYSISRILSGIKLPIVGKIMNDHRESQVELLRLMAARDADKKIRYRFWQRGGGYDRNLISKDAVISSIQYIHANPVRRGLVETPEDWPWSSARFYARREDYVMKMDDEILGILT